MKKLLLTLIGLVTVGFATLAQSKDVGLVWEQRKVKQECRYCGEKSHTSYLGNIYFEETELNELYTPALRKYQRNAAWKCALDNGKKFSEICDMSRTGRHGFEEEVEIITHNELVSLEEIKEFTDDYNQKKYEENKKKEFNQLFLNCLDSFNIAADQCVKLEVAGLSLLYDKYFELMEIASKLDSNGLVYVNQNYHIDGSGFGVEDTEFNFIRLEQKMLWRICYLSKFEEALERRNKWEQRNINVLGEGWKGMYDYNGIFIYLGLNDHKLAINEVDKYLNRWDDFSKKQSELAGIVADLRKIHGGQNESNLEILSKYKGFGLLKIQLFISRLLLKYPLLVDAEKYEY